MIFPILIFIAITLIWYLPMYKKQGKMNKQPFKLYIKAFLFGLLSTVAAVILQSMIGLPVKIFGIGGTEKNLIDAFICAAIVEEAMKLLFTWLALKRHELQRRIDYVLLFGAVGLGFQATESIFAIFDGSYQAAIVRGLLALHLAWQLFYGYFIYGYVEAKKEGNKKSAALNLIFGIAVPVITHGLHDFITMMALDVMTKIQSLTNNMADLRTDMGWLESITTADEIWIYASFAEIFLAFGFLIYTVVLGHKAAKQSKQKEAQVTAENE